MPFHTDRSFHSTSAKSKSGNFTEGNEGNKDPETLRELRFLLSNLRVSVPSMQNQFCADSFLGIWHSRFLFASVSSPDPTTRKLHGRTSQSVLRGSRRESRHPKPHQANADGNRGELSLTLSLDPLIKNLQSPQSVFCTFCCSRPRLLGRAREAAR